MSMCKVMLVLSTLMFVDADELPTNSDEAFMSTPEILENRNINFETHSVVSEDGYILSIFRIPREERKGVVVLQHSLGFQSTVFLISRKRSIAMEVYNDGFEVWLPNFRGLPFSDKHTRNLKKLEYWDFSFHEVGYYDQSAVLGYISNYTESKLIVISHSFSSTSSLVYSSLRPKDAEKYVKVFVNMATSAFMNHTTSPFKYLIDLEFMLLKPLMATFNIGAINYEFRSFENLGKQFILAFLPSELTKYVLEFALGFLFGGSKTNIDSEEMSMVFGAGSQPVALKIMYHYSQLIQSGRFCMYDYGIKKNLKIYNSSMPPDYPLENIKVPIYLVVSDSDILSDSWGSNKLYDLLPDKAKVYGKLDIHNVNHADYVVSADRFEYFQEIIKFINSVN